MTISLENTFLKVSFDEHGGELTSLFNKKINLNIFGRLILSIGAVMHQSCFQSLVD
ncbi:hypothetical protein [Liquorilactobacillus mali]|uniref:hypothetical protein n=1 Tax=Liquorilactobacillus mali TaxID=1618 RepID=UPI001F25CA7F|nr:hypothetical protein [Liquorilactobacillus mali]